MNCSHCGAPSALAIRAGGALFCRACFDRYGAAALAEQRDAEKANRPRVYGRLRWSAFEDGPPWQATAIRAMEDKSEETL